MKNQQEKVVHNYHDYSTEEKVDDNKIVEDKPATEGQSESNRVEQNFPVKLHYMLSELESDGMEDIIAWQPHGRCFVVHRQNDFVEKILPLWFRQSKFPSFQRQLNLYGFKRITAGRDKGAYYHELFLRNKRFLAHIIERIKVKGRGARKPSSPETEPYFYQLPYLPLNKVVRQIIRPMPHGAMMTEMNPLFGVGGSLSLHQLLASSSLAGGIASIQQHRAAQQFASAPLFNPGRALNSEPYKAHGHFPMAPMIRSQQEVYMRNRELLASLGHQQQGMPTGTGPVRRHGDNDAMAMEMFLSQQQQQGRNDSTALASFLRGGSLY